jgi:hypothetical protein
MSAPPFDLKTAISEHRAAKAAKAANSDPPLAGLAALAGGDDETENSPAGAGAPGLATFAGLAIGPLESENSHVPSADETERAAIAEHEGGLPRGWANALAAVAHHEKPRGRSADEWADMVRKAWAFADRHGAALDAEGWRFAEVFGEPRAWFNRRGVAWLDQGLLEAVVLEISADAIRWCAPSGHVLTKWKAGRSPGVTIEGAS